MYPQALNLDPTTLLPNPWNPNHVSPANEAKLEESIRRRGMFKPVIVREVAAGYEILGGEHRTQVSVKLGLPTIPVFNLGPLDEKQAMEIGLLDNARYGADDLLSLQAILNQIGNSDDLAGFLPYSDTELADILVSSDATLLDGIDVSEDDEPASESEAPDERVPRTHTIMRFKVPLSDAERIQLRIADAQKRYGFTLADEMTNAGDALVHLLVTESKSVMTYPAA